MATSAPTGSPGTPETADRDDAADSPRELSDADYLRRILTARVYDVAIESPLEVAPDLSERLGNRVLFKREDLQPVFSFKLRGAFNKMAALTEGERARGVVAASAGNHAQGVALAAQHLGCDAVIVMPSTTAELKVDAVRALGASIILHGETFAEAGAHAIELAAERGSTFVHPFDDPDVIAGQGTIAVELLRQHGSPIHAVFVAVGGGGLISGVATYIKQIRPEIRVIGVQHAEATAMGDSLAAGERVLLRDVGLFSDGTAVKQVGVETFRLCQRHVDEIITVSTDETCAAIKDVFTDTRTLLEPAGALAVAGLKTYVEREGISDETLVAVTCGANMNFDRLRFVAERAELGERREAVYAVTIPERPGTFLRFCEVVGQRDVTEFNYRISSGDDAHVFVGIGVSGPDEADGIADAFRAAGFDTIDLTDDEFAKLHLRHLVGGRSERAHGEVVYRFEFPERPGALLGFLRSMRPDWNISLFHYRNHGSDAGRVLVGIQVPDEDRSALDDVLTELGYRYWDETDNPAYRRFL
ncbi:MAG: threonine ammonia-lyase, biosynthetic [Actinomycetota bacterium]